MLRNIQLYMYSNINILRDKQKRIKMVIKLQCLRNIFLKSDLNCMIVL